MQYPVLSGLSQFLSMAGNYYPSVKLAHDIAKVLKTTIDDLFIFEDT
jgi:hypothetical protein